MHLTDAQIATLKAAILADPVLAATPPGPDGDQAIADALNLTASPAFVVWRTSVSVDSLMSGAFVWTEVDNLTVGKARIWDWMSRLGSVNPSSQNVRDGLLACFGANSGTAAAAIPLLKRNATRGEKLFATGTGTTASPAVMVVVGNMDRGDVERARNS